VFSALHQGGQIPRLSGYSHLSFSHKSKNSSSRRHRERHLLRSAIYGFTFDYNFFSSPFGWGEPLREHTPVGLKFK